MVERGGRPRLALKAFEREGIRRQRRRQQLDGDAAPKPRIFRFLDDAHAALAECSHDR